MGGERLLSLALWLISLVEYPCLRVVLEVNHLPAVGMGGLAQGPLSVFTPEWLCPGSRAGDMEKGHARREQAGKCHGAGCAIPAGNPEQIWPMGSDAEAVSLASRGGCVTEPTPQMKTLRPSCGRGIA